jgi:signal peptidase I
MDGAVIGTWDRPLPAGARASTAEPVRIGARRLGVVIENLRLCRDVHYTRPTGVHARWGIGRPVQLGEDEFFLLGDNSPVSEDSRTWPGGPGVAANLLIGRPLLVHFSLRQARLGPLEFQVPDPTRMRYIP